MPDWIATVYEFSPIPEGHSDRHHFTVRVERRVNREGEITWAVWVPKTAPDTPTAARHGDDA